MSQLPLSISPMGLFTSGPVPPSDLGEKNQRFLKKQLLFTRPVIGKENCNNKPVVNISVKCIYQVCMYRWVLYVYLYLFLTKFSYFWQYFNWLLRFSRYSVTFVNDNFDFFPKYYLSFLSQSMCYNLDF